MAKNVWQQAGRTNDAMFAGLVKKTLRHCIHFFHDVNILLKQSVRIFSGEAEPSPEALLQHPF